jgi:hypothetical protein
MPTKSVYFKFGIWEALQSDSPLHWVRPWYPLYPCCLLLYLEDGGSSFLQNVDTFLSHYTAYVPQDRILHVQVFCV